MPFVTPRDTGYPSVVVALANQHAELLGDQAVLRYWAQYRFGNQYNRVAGQEFKLQPLLAQARQDLQATASATPARTVIISAATTFGEYDFTRHLFPVQIGGDQFQIYQSPCCQQSDNLPRNITLHASGLDAIDSLPMSSEDAQHFVEGRTRYGSVDRQLTLLVTVSLDKTGIPPGDTGQPAQGTVVSVDAVGGRRLETLVYRYTALQLATLRDARAAHDAQVARAAEAQRQAQVREAARQQADIERQQMASQSQYMLGNLQSEPAAARLRNFMMPGASIGGSGLDNLRDARGEALLSGRSISVIMLVHADSSGTSGIATSWPGHLAISAPAGARSIASGGWYLVSGQLSVPQGEDLPDAQLRAETMFACARDECADAAEPAAIVKHKLAQAGLATSSP